MCSRTPRFSYSGSETVICACPAGTSTDPAVCTAPVSVRGGYQGGYSRVGIRGAIPGTTQLPQGASPDSEAGPVAPARGRSGWSGCSGCVPGSRPPTPGSCRPFRGPLRCLDPSLGNAASWPIRARIRVPVLKVSKKRRSVTRKVLKGLS